MHTYKTIARGIGDIPLRRVPIGSTVRIGGWMGERLPRWRFKMLTGRCGNNRRVIAGKRLERGSVVLAAPSLKGLLWMVFDGKDIVEFNGGSEGGPSGGWN